MTNRFKAMIYAAIIGLIIVAIFLGFLSGLDNYVSWILIIVLLMIPFIYKRTNQTKQLLWQEEYSVGVDSLDQDHKKLISLLNQFSTAYDYAMSESYEREALDDLISYTRYHFEREEKLMEEANYPDIEEHKKQHKVMFEQVESFVELYNKKGHDALDEVSGFLSHWLINHICGTDKKYSEHLNEHGIK